jgi:hypothetical protein
MAPLSANATEVNLNEISNYSDVESIELANSFDDSSSNEGPLLAGGEGLVDSSDSFDGGFSETTTASFGVNFYAGVDKDDDNPAVGANDFDDNLTTGYDFNIALNTSFTGEDSLDVELQAGNAGTAGIGEFAGDTTTAEALTVDEISYTFPLGDNITVMVGDNKDASSLFTTACVYGTPSDTLDACGNVNAAVDNGGVMAGATYDFGNGLTAAVGYAGAEGDVANEEGADAYGFNIAYTGDAYGVSFTYGALEDGVARDNMGTDFAYALNAYYTPDTDGLPTISVGYEYGEDDSAAAAADEYTNVFAGVQWDEVGPGTLGVGIGSRVNTVEDTDAQYQTEAFYEYPVNDGMTITGLVYVKDVSTAGTDDTTGVMVKTSFSF